LSIHLNKASVFIQVTFKFDKDQGEPGDQTMYTLSSASDSLCGIGVIDRSLELLAGNSFILKKNVCKGFLVKIVCQLKLCFSLINCIFQY